MKRKALAIALISIIILSSVSWLVYNQISDFQSQNGYLRTQNSELQGNISDSRSQIGELQIQNREQQDRLKDFTYQLSLTRHLLVKITAFTWVGGFNPIGGLTLYHPVNVTVQNNDSVPLSGLTLTVRLANENSGVQIEREGISPIDRINVGESKVISGGPLTTLRVDGSSPLTDAVCVATLKVGDIVLDEWKQAI